MKPKCPWSKPLDPTQRHHVKKLKYIKAIWKKEKNLQFFFPFLALDNCCKQNSFADEII